MLKDSPEVLAKRREAQPNEVFRRTAVRAHLIDGALRAMGAATLTTLRRRITIAAWRPVAHHMVDRGAN